MEMVKIKSKEIKIAEHSFYCDECDKYLGTSQEYDDGWYERLGEFELNLYIDDWYQLKKCLCDDCRRSVLTNIEINLMNLGFKKD